MIRRRNHLITIAGDEAINFVMLQKDGCFNTLAGLPMEAFLDDGQRVENLPRSALQAVNRLLVVPDYWVGNRFHEFQSRKNSVVSAFIERKLKQEKPELTEGSDFYDYAIVQAPDHRQQLYAFYLQETVAYQLYHRLEALALSPLRITTPALVWQAKLRSMVEGFANNSVGLIHLVETDCFLYFFFMGQFLFSRQIQLPETDEDAGEIYNLLNYEINQSFYHYSQKTKRSVDTLFMMSPDPEAAFHLAGLLEREVKGLDHPPSASGITNETMIPVSCKNFTASDLGKNDVPAISYKPLKKELAWRPVQWAGIAVGLFLIMLLVLEHGYLHLCSRSASQQMAELSTSSEQPPDQVLQEMSGTLEEITRELARPSGRGTLVRTLLAMPDAVTVKKLSLDVSETPFLKVDAVVNADSPESFKNVLSVFLERLNAKFSLTNRPLREKDVTIQLDRSDGDGRKPVYRINLGFDIS